MAKQKLSSREQKEMMKQFDEGRKVVEIAEEFKVHQSTVSRYVIRHKKPSRQKTASLNSFDKKVKTELRKLLIHYVDKPDEVISELGVIFDIKLSKRTDEFEIIYL